MKKTALAVLSALAMTTAAHADYFYNKKITVGGHPWKVFGEPYVKGKQNLICKAEADYEDGSYFLVAQDFTDTDTFGLYMFVHDTEWEIQADKFPMDVKVQANTYASNGHQVRSGELSGVMSNKNSMFIPKLEPKEVYDVLSHATMLKLVMPGNVPNAVIKGIGPQIAHSLGECFTEARKLQDKDGEANFVGPTKKGQGI